MTAINLKVTALNSKLLRRFVGDTVKMLQRVDMRKHQTAVMTVFHAAQFGEASQLNVFASNLKVNDVTALKAWIVKNFSGEVDGKPVHWLSYTNKKDKQGNVIGFHVLKDTKDYRVDRYDFDALMLLDPFYNVDVSQPKDWNLNALLEVLIKAHDTITKKADKEGIELPAEFVSALEEAKTKAVMFHIDEATVVALEEKATNDNTDDMAEPVVASAE